MPGTTKTGRRSAVKAPKILGEKIIETDFIPQNFDVAELIQYLSNVLTTAKNYGFDRVFVEYNCETARTMLVARRYAQE